MFCVGRKTRLRKAASLLNSLQAQGEATDQKKHLKTLLLLGMAIGKEAHVFPQVANICSKLGPGSMNLSWM